MKPVFIVLIVIVSVALLMALGFLGYKYFVAARSMDKDGMQTPELPEPLDGDGSIFDTDADLAKPWHSEGGYTVSLEDGIITLYKDGKLICKKEYIEPETVINKRYAKDGGTFGEFLYFEYTSGSLYGQLAGDEGREIMFFH